MPVEAEAIVSRIEAMIVQADRLLARGGSDEAAFALRETERRYLPDTLTAFLDIPPARRDAPAVEMFLDQLRLLERATAQRLATLSETAEVALSANGAFLTERFGPVESLPAVAPVDGESTALASRDGQAAPPATLVRRVLESLDAVGGAEPGAILERAATRLAAAFPTVATVKRAGFLGKGPVEAVALDVPRRDDLLRYMLARAPHGGIEASVTRFLRGIKNKTLIVDVGEWTQGLIDDLGAYVERERNARDTLTRLFRETR